MILMGVVIVLPCCNIAIMGFQGTLKVSRSNLCLYLAAPIAWKLAQPLPEDSQNDALLPLYLLIQFLIVSRPITRVKS